MREAQRLTGAAMVGAAVVAALLPAAVSSTGELEAVAAAVRRSNAEREVQGLLVDRLGALEADPGAEAWVDLGVALHAHGLLELAGRCYRAGLALAADRARWTYWLAMVENEQGRPGVAATLFERALELSPEYAPIHRRLGDLRLEAGDLEAAAAHYRRLAQLRPGIPDGSFGLARVALQRADFEEAAEHAMAGLRLRPRDRYGAGLLGAAYRGLGRIDRATPLLAAGLGQLEEPADPWAEEIVAQRTGPTHWLKVASSYYRRGEVEEILSRLLAALESRPDDVRLMNKIAEGYLVDRRLDAARAILERALALAPDSFSTHLNLAQLHRFAGEPDAALRSLDRAIAVNEGAWQTHLLRGRVLLALGDARRAADAFDRALARGAHKDLEARLERAELHMIFGEFEQARPIFTEVVTQYPFLSRAIAGLAACQAEAGELDVARRTLAAAGASEDRRLRLVARRIEQLAAQQSAGAPPR